MKPNLKFAIARVKEFKSSGLLLSSGQKNTKEELSGEEKKA